MSNPNPIPVSETEAIMMVQSLMAIIEATSMALEDNPGDVVARDERQVARKLLLKIIIRAITHNNEHKNTLTLSMEADPKLN
jgi:hypothetical protein